ncbi:hypothetical protein RQP46_005965 [Phenoliferia psychrophenolica]
MASKQLATDNTSVRAKSKAGAGAGDASRKTVFRPVLDNPHVVQWPPLSAPIRKLILDELISLLETPLAPDDLPIADWRLQEHARRRGRTHGAGKGKGKATGDAAPADNGGGAKGRAAATAPKAGPSTVSTPTTPSDPSSTHSLALRSNLVVNVPDYVDKPQPARAPAPKPPPRPQLLNHLTIGINEVTRALESRIRWGRWELGDPSAAPGGGAAAAAASAATGSATATTAPPPKRRRRQHSKHPAAILTLDPLHPISAVTLQRPSYRFLFHSLPKPSTRLPPYLLPPSETNPFFRMLANEHSFKLKKPRVKDVALDESLAGFNKRNVQFALLEDVMKDDHTKLAREKLAKAILEAPSRAKKVPAAKKGAAKAKAAKDVAPKVASPALPEADAEALPEDDAEAVTATPAVTLASGDPLGTTDATAKEDEEPDWVSMIDIVFVCKPDINPPSLVEHLPNMVAAANGVMEATKSALQADDPPVASTSSMDVDAAEGDADDEATSKVSRPAQHGVFLVQLDLGAELRLGDVLALRRSLTAGAGPLLALIQQHVQPLSAPWLIPHVSNPVPRSNPASREPRQLIETHVKHLRTTAPKDPKQANAATKLARQTAKKRKRGEEAEVYMAED